MVIPDGKPWDDTYQQDFKQQKKQNFEKTRNKR